MASGEPQSRFSHLPPSTTGPIECAVAGSVLLENPYFNKGSAHTAEERRAFNLAGLLPSSIQSLDQQAHRAYQQYCLEKDDLAKNTFLTSLKDQNLVLYFRVRWRTSGAPHRRRSPARAIRRARCRGRLLPPGAFRPPRC